VPQPYSQDLRSKILDAYQRKEGSLAELAVRFSVSHGYTKKIRQHQHRTDQKTPPVPKQRAAPKVTVAVRQQVRRLWQAQPDATLAALCDRLVADQGPRLSLARMCTLLQQLDLPRKKDASRLCARPPRGRPTTRSVAGASGRARPGAADLFR
jgi:transposase